VVPYLFTGLAGYLLGPETSRSMRKLTRTTPGYKNKKVLPRKQFFLYKNKNVQVVTNFF